MTAFTIDTASGDFLTFLKQLYLGAPIGEAARLAGGDVPAAAEDDFETTAWRLTKTLDQVTEILERPQRQEIEKCMLAFIAHVERQIEATAAEFN